MVFQRLQRFVIFMGLIELLRALYGTGIFQPIEEYLVSLKRRITQKIFEIFIKVGTAISLFAVLVRSLMSISAIYYLTFFVTLFITYQSWIYWNSVREDQFDIVSEDEILEAIVNEEYVCLDTEIEKEMGEVGGWGYVD